jgi:hypothetical protein
MIIAILIFGTLPFVARLLRHRFSQQTSRYNPSLVRTGRGSGESTRQVSLEVMVQQLMQEKPDVMRERIERVGRELRQIVEESRVIRSKLRALTRNVPSHLPLGWEARVMQAPDR